MSDVKKLNCDASWASTYLKGFRIVDQSYVLLPEHPKSAIATI